MAELTDNTRKDVHDTWDIVRKNLRKHALDFFLCFFKRHPEHQKLFHDFKDVRVSELPNEQKFRGHAVRVFFAITSLIDNLDDLDTVVDILQKTARDHKPRGVKGQQFEDLFETILYYLETTLGESFTGGRKESWETVSKVILSVIHKEQEADLTSEKKSLVRDSWAPIRKNTRKYAMEFFLLFFKRYPEYMSLFHDFEHVNVDDLPGEQKFRGHAVRVFFAITSLVDSLDDLDIVVSILEKTAHDHYPRGVRSNHFEDLFATILAFLEQTLGDQFNNKTRGAWETTAKVILGVLHTELNAIETNNLHKLSI